VAPPDHSDQRKAVSGSPPTPDPTTGS
jgi:hypothetical protein